MKKFFLRFVVAIFALIALCLFAQAQDRSLETFAITNARIVSGTGLTTERGTVVIRNGLIESIGENTRVPADARVIDGTGLTVYPGLINANSNLGFPAPAARTQPTTGQGGGQFLLQQLQAQAQAPQTNSNYPAGLQPETSAADQIRAGDAQFETIRNLGFTTALTVSRDGIFNGQSALINLAGDSVSDMIIVSPVAQHFTFRTLGTGAFPVSLMGTFAAFRQMMLDAQRLQAIRKMYDANPRGLPRPEADKSLEALFPILNREMPIAFNANSEREIIRVLDLAKEFNIKTIVVGGQEAWKVTDRLKAQNVPVLLSINFPKRTASASPDADPETLELLRARAEAPKAPARLAAAGVKFAFQDGGMTNMADFVANANKAVENGLAKDTAIRAMTLSAAEIFGVDNRLGSIEKGKIANLFVTRGDLFAKDKTVTHVFVDGKLFEPKAAPATPTRGGGRPNAGEQTTPGTTTPAFVNVNGIWNITIDVPGQQFTATLNLQQETKNLSGTMVFQNQTVQVKDGEVTSDGFKFTTTVEFGGNTVPLTVNGKVSGNQMTGTFNAPQGVFPFTGTRNP
jgi:imidazolonepropionase-like amidohydrolase